MGKTTAIQWCDATWNPWQGCTPVASGCAHCYMFREKRAFGQDPTRVIRSKERTFNGPLSWHEPKRIFVCSWSDFFHEAADPWRAEAWPIILACGQHTFIIPTKRSERVLGCLPTWWGRRVHRPWSNVWILASASTQVELEAALPVSQSLPVSIRGVSIEPLLGPIRIPQSAFRNPRPDWVIVAGESGGPPERALVRPMRNAECGMRNGGWEPKAEALAWVRQIRDDCQAAGVPFFFKGWGGPRPTSGGRELDGREWSEFPIANCELRNTPHRELLGDSVCSPRDPGEAGVHEPAVDA
jgi:protein gp37